MGRKDVCRFQSGQTTVQPSGGSRVGYASLHSESTERKARPGLLSGPVSVAQKPGRGGEMEEQEATWGRPARSGVFANAGARGQSRGWRSVCQEPGWSHRGSLRFTDEQLFCFLFLLLPSAGMEAPPSLPTPVRAFPHPVLQTPAISQTFLLEARTHTSLVQLLLTFSHCFWKGSSPYVLLLRQWQRIHDSQEGWVEMVPTVIPRRFTRLRIPSWEGGRAVRLSPRTPLSFLGVH